MASQPGKQTIAIHILSNISRSKDNQIMKFHQLIEYNVRNIFLEKSYAKWDGEGFPKSFLKYQNWAYLLINSTVIQFVLLYLQVDNHQNILCWPFAFTFSKGFLKTQRGLELASQPHFLQFFFFKYIPLFIV